MSRARDLADRVLHNRTHEDTDGGRESILTFKGEQSGGEISTLAQIQASHDGTSDDEKADLIFKTNDGSDGASPTEAMRITSQQRVGIGTNDPDANLEIASSAGTLQLTDTDGTNQNTSIFQSGGSFFIQARDNTANAPIVFAGNGGGTFDEYMRIDADGQLGLGATSLGTETLTVAKSSGTPTIRVNAPSGSEAQLKLQANGGGTTIPMIAAKTDGSLSFSRWTGAAYTERMRINNDGIVTQPYQPVFHAHQASNDSFVVADTVFAFNATTVNVGSHFDTSNYRFVAPVAGHYLFSWGGSLAMTSPDDYITSYLRKNGSNAGGARARTNAQHSSGTKYESHAGATIHYMAVNDYMEVWHYGSSNGNAYALSSEFSFCGFFIG